MTRTPDPHHRHRFPAEINSHAVWLYHTFCLSFRDVELMLAERGIEVSYETIRQWCRKFALSRDNQGENEASIWMRKCRERRAGVRA